MRSAQAPSGMLLDPAKSEVTVSSQRASEL